MLNIDSRWIVGVEFERGMPLDIIQVTEQILSAFKIPWSIASFGAFRTGGLVDNWRVNSFCESFSLNIGTILDELNIYKYLQGCKILMLLNYNVKWRAQFSFFNKGFYVPALPMWFTVKSAVMALLLLKDPFWEQCERSASVTAMQTMKLWAYIYFTSALPLSVYLIMCTFYLLALANNESTNNISKTGCLAILHIAHMHISGLGACCVKRAWLCHAV